ncbi:MAG: hypothetical protein MUP68_17705 [Deltaproteobacteria bacterium]|nr:hypothetical protein [Deltaproteobacteria bacterium]
MMKEGEIHPPVRAGQPLPGPGGEVLRRAKRWWFFHDLELYFHRCSKNMCFLCSLFAEANRGPWVNALPAMIPRSWPSSPGENTKLRVGKGRYACPPSVLEWFEDVSSQGGEVFHGEWVGRSVFKLAKSVVQRRTSNW